MQREELLTRQEAAERAGVTINTIKLWMHAGMLHPIGPAKVGRRPSPVIRASELETVIARRREKSLTAQRIWA